MQEGTSSLMQMAKVAVAVEALHQAKLPFIAGNVLNQSMVVSQSVSQSINQLIDQRVGHPHHLMDLGKSHPYRPFPLSSDTHHAVIH